MRVDASEPLRFSGRDIQLTLTLGLLDQRRCLGLDAVAGRGRDKVLSSRTSSSTSRMSSGMLRTEARQLGHVIEY